MTNKYLGIISGFKNFMFPNKEMEELALERSKICSECSSAVETKIKQLQMDDTIKEIEGLKCADCGCILSAKVRQKFDNCPQKKW